jgi:hypothetical protein
MYSAASFSPVQRIFESGVRGLWITLGQPFISIENPLCSNFSDSARSLLNARINRSTENSRSTNIAQEDDPFELASNFVDNGRVLEYVELSLAVLFVRSVRRCHEMHLLSSPGKRLR